MTDQKMRRIYIDAGLHDLDGVRSIAEVRKWLCGIEKQVPDDGTLHFEINGISYLTYQAGGRYCEIGGAA